MRTSRLLFFESFLLLLVVATSAVAQDSKASIKTIAGKKKVYVETDVAASRKAIEKVLREEGGLEVVQTRDAADFLVFRSGYFEQKSDRPLTLNNDLPTLPESGGRRVSVDEYNKTRYIGVHITHIEVFTLDAAGNRTLVWSERISSQVSNIPAVRGTVTTRSDVPTPEPARYTPPKDNDAKLTRRFVKKFKSIS